MPESALDGFAIRERGETFWALSREEGVDEPAAFLKVVSQGLPLARRLSKYLKPTSPALRLLSPWITRNRVWLDEPDALRLLAHREIAWSGELSEGYVLLETDAGPLGCGLALPGRLRAELPRSEVRTLGLAGTKPTRSREVDPIAACGPDSAEANSVAFRREKPGGGEGL